MSSIHVWIILASEYFSVYHTWAVFNCLFFEFTGNVVALLEFRFLKLNYSNSAMLGQHTPATQNKMFCLVLSSSKRRPLTKMFTFKIQKYKHSRNTRSRDIRTPTSYYKTIQSIVWPDAADTNDDRKITWSWSLWPFSVLCHQILSNSLLGLFAHQVSYIKLFRA